MKVVVISSPEEVADEVKIMTALFKAGLERYHLRKPRFSTNKLRRLLNRVPVEYRDRIVIHSHHELCVPYKLAGIHITEHHRKRHYWQTWLLMKYLKLRRPQLEITAGFHTIGSLRTERFDYAYVFLSPVFDSISKIGYRSTFHEDSLQKVISKSDYKVFALGGVDEDKIEKAAGLGFYGVALLGSIWKSDEPVEKFKRVQHLCKSNVAT
ncbi:MAG: thiamine phosphate synthase [Chitinophagales bacterium]|nr:thiamine phosphate synthase [Chitinophagales bacterium]